MASASVNQPPSAAQLQAREALAQWLWVTGIVGFFLIQAVLWMFALVLTNNDPSHAIVADFDERASSWDDHRTAVAASDQLGWTYQIDISAQADALSQRTIDVIVRDSTQQPVELDSLSLSIFHCARVAQKKDLPMQRVAPGVWQAITKLDRAGRWQLSGSAEQGEKRLLINQRQDLTF